MTEALTTKFRDDRTPPWIIGHGVIELTSFPIIRTLRKDVLWYLTSTEEFAYDLIYVDQPDCRDL